MRGFIDFIRAQGVIGLAIGFILGGAVSKVVSALVTDIINPLVGLLLGSTTGLKEASFAIGSAKIMWGDFVSIVIDFIVIAAVIYFGFKMLRLEKLDKKA
jgi:large conductance mechanosensitive channel